MGGGAGGSGAGSGGVCQVARVLESNVAAQECWFQMSLSCCWITRTMR